MNFRIVNGVSYFYDDFSVSLAHHKCRPPDNQEKVQEHCKLLGL